MTYDTLRPPMLESEFRAKLAEAVAAERERCAKIAEHLSGWGIVAAPELAAHIAKVIRRSTE